MSLYQKLRLLVRASAEQPARKLVEMNDIKIFEQELIEIERAIKSAKLHLAKVKAEAKMLTVANAELSDKLMFREQQTLEAMDKDADLAQELAAQIAEEEVILRDQQKQLRHLHKMEEKLTADLKKAVRALEGHYRQLQILKASQFNQRRLASGSMQTQGLNSALREVSESLAAIQNRQSRADYLDEAEAEVESHLSGNSLDQRLEASGIRTGKHDAMAVLERLKLRKTATSLSA